MKIIAAIMDVVHVKTDGKIKQYYITKIKKCLVYDPSKVNGWDIEKKVKDDNNDSTYDARNKTDGLASVQGFYIWRTPQVGI